MPKYNSTYKIKHESLKEQVVMVSMTYEQVIATANVLEDLHTLLDSPDTIHDYPVQDVEEIHTAIRNAMVNCKISLEMMYESK